jgi:hypothetical protein
LIIFGGNSPQGISSNLYSLDFESLTVEKVKVNLKGRIFCQIFLIAEKIFILNGLTNNEYNNEVVIVNMKKNNETKTFKNKILKAGQCYKSFFVNEKVYFLAVMNFEKKIEKKYVYEINLNDLNSKKYPLGLLFYDLYLERPYSFHSSFLVVENTIIIEYQRNYEKMKQLNNFKNILNRPDDKRTNNELIKYSEEKKNLIENLKSLTIEMSEMSNKKKGIINQMNETDSIKSAMISQIFSFLEPKYYLNLFLFSKKYYNMTKNNMMMILYEYGKTSFLKNYFDNKKFDYEKLILNKLKEYKEGDEFDELINKDLNSSMTKINDLTEKNKNRNSMTRTNDIENPNNPPKKKSIFGRIIEPISKIASDEKRNSKKEEKVDDDFEDDLLISNFALLTKNSIKVKDTKKVSQNNDKSIKNNNKLNEKINDNNEKINDNNEKINNEKINNHNNENSNKEKEKLNENSNIIMIEKNKNDDEEEKSFDDFEKLIQKKKNKNKLLEFKNEEEKGITFGEFTKQNEIEKLKKTKNRFNFKDDDEGTLQDYIKQTSDEISIEDIQQLIKDFFNSKNNNSKIEMAVISKETIFENRKKYLFFLLNNLKDFDESKRLMIILSTFNLSKILGDEDFEFLFYLNYFLMIKQNEYVFFNEFFFHLIKLLKEKEKKELIDKYFGVYHQYFVRQNLFLGDLNSNVLNMLYLKLKISNFIFKNTKFENNQIIEDISIYQNIFNDSNFNQNIIFNLINLNDFAEQSTLFFSKLLEDLKLEKIIVSSYENLISPNDNNIFKDIIFYMNQFTFFLIDSIINQSIENSKLFIYSIIKLIKLYESMGNYALLYSIHLFYTHQSMKNIFSVFSLKKNEEQVFENLSRYFNIEDNFSKYRNIQKNLLLKGDPIIPWIYLSFYHETQNYIKSNINNVQNFDNYITIDDESPVTKKKFEKFEFLNKINNDKIKKISRVQFPKSNLTHVLSFFIISKIQNFKYHFVVNVSSQNLINFILNRKYNTDRNILVKISNLYLINKI